MSKETFAIGYSDNREGFKTKTIETRSEKIKSLCKFNRLKLSTTENDWQEIKILMLLKALIITKDEEINLEELNLGKYENKKSLKKEIIKEIISLEYIFSKLLGGEKTLKDKLDYLFYKGFEGEEKQNKKGYYEVELFEKWYGKSVGKWFENCFYNNFGYKIFNFSDIKSIFKEFDFVFNYNDYSEEDEIIYIGIEKNYESDLKLTKAELYLILYFILDYTGFGDCGSSDSIFIDYDSDKHDLGLKYAIHFLALGLDSGYPRTASIYNDDYLYKYYKEGGVFKYDIYEKFFVEKTFRNNLSTLEIKDNMLVYNREDENDYKYTHDEIFKTLLKFCKENLNDKKIMIVDEDDDSKEFCDSAFGDYDIPDYNAVTIHNGLMKSNYKDFKFKYINEEQD